MSISNIKALQYKADFDQEELLWGHMPHCKEIAQVLCSERWGVSLESAKRYIRLGNLLESNYQQYAEELEETHPEEPHYWDDSAVDFINEAEEMEEIHPNEGSHWDDSLSKFDGLIGLGCETKEPRAEYEKMDESIFPILCIPDLHIPFEHPSALQFCKDIRDEYQPKTVVNLGDLNDQHSLSFHTNEPDAISAQQELDKAKVTCKKWFKEFPNVYLCLGNHDNIPARRAKEMGIPKSYLKSFHDLWDAPETWNVASSHQIGGVKFTHAGKAGFAGAINSAIVARQSLCVGHQHSFGGVLYQANEQDIIFGANGGCLIDNDAYAFRYGKEFPNKPTLGCLIVHSATECQFIPMGGKYLRSNK